MTSDFNTAMIDAFLALQISGAVIFAFTILSVCIFRGTNRHPIWFSFSISWIIFGISYSFLLFAGQQYKTPSKIPCTIQAALVYAAPYLVMGSSLGLIIHLLLNVLSALSQSPKQPRYRTLINSLIVLPWIIWTAAIVGLLVFGFSHPLQIAISPNGTYCVIQNSIIPKFTAVSATIASTAIVVIELFIGSLLYRNRAIMNIFSQSMTMAVRILVFTILGCGALGIGLVFTITRTRGAAFDVVIALLTPMAALTFCTQMDLIKRWMFWRKSQPVVPADQTILTLASMGSQIFPSRTSMVTREGNQSSSATPYLKLANASSFLHF